jgi:cell division protein FtsB
VSPASTVRRAVWPAAALLAVIGLTFLAVLPTKTYLAQRRERAAVGAQLRVLANQNRRLEDQSRLLHTDAEIERLAREQYNLVLPGEEAYALLPAPVRPPTGTTTSTTAPPAGARP